MILSTSRKRCQQAKSFQEVGQKRKMLIKINPSLSPECKIVPFKKGFKKLLVGLGHIVYKKGIKRNARRHKQMKSLQPSTN